MNKIIELIKNNKVIALLITIVLILIIIVFSIKKDDNEIKKEYRLKLFGESNITLKNNEEYIEPGYFAYYGNDNVTNQVTVSGNVDSKKAGTYVIIGALLGNNLKIDNIIPEHISSLLDKLKQANANIQIYDNYIITNKSDNLKKIDMIASLKSVD